jgi:hypothetical protein
LASTIPPRALLLGASGRYPFNGHLRLVVERGTARLHLAGSLGVGCEPPVAHAAASALRGCLAGVEGRDRFALLRSAWERLALLDLELLGPTHGEDLALLMVAEDTRGLGVAGTGLAALYALDAVAEPLIEIDHPLLGIRGIPATPPGVFTPNVTPPVVVAAAATGALEPGPGASWRRACGLHDEASP